MSGSVSMLLPYNILNNKSHFQISEENPISSKRRALPPIPAFSESESKEKICKKLKLTDNLQQNATAIISENQKSSKIEVEDITERYLQNRKFQNILKKVSYNKEKNEFELLISNEYIHPFTQQLEMFNNKKCQEADFGLSSKPAQVEESKIQTENPACNKVYQMNIKEETLGKKTTVTASSLEKIKNIHKILGYRLLRDLFRDRIKWDYQREFLSKMEDFLQRQKIDANDFRNWVDQNWLTFRYKDGHEEKKCILQSRRDFVFLIEYSEKKEKLLQSLRNNLKQDQNNKLVKDIIYGEKLRKLAYLWLKKYSSSFLTEKSNRLSEGHLYLEKVPDILRLFQDYKLKREKAC